ncbi:MAG: hypothetical protein U1F43_35865 [Myxococcota bacterium]
MIALADIGDLDCVPELQRLTKGVFRSGRRKELARAAIEAIRRRHGASENPGALTLADDDRHGRLALDGEATTQEDAP